MYNPTTRLLTILELLQARGQLSAQELAQRLEVEERSIRRYIMMLRDMGIPIESERGRYGGYSLRPGFRLPPLMFNHDEIVAVMVGLMFAEDSGALAVESARAKIERVLPDDLKQKSLALQQALSLDTDVLRGYPVDGAMMLALGLAVSEQRALHIHYRDVAGRLTERNISPYGIVMHGRAFYLAGYCHLREALRTFRLERVQDVRESNTDFMPPPPDFDAKAYVLNALAHMHDLEMFEVRIHAPKATVAATVPASMAILDEVDGETLMRCYSDDAFWLARFLAGLELRFTVLGTDALRDALHTLAKRLIESSVLHT